MFYAVTVQTTPGQGDYNTDQTTIIEDNMSIATLVRTIRELEHAGHQVSVFRGQGLGICEYETE